MRHPKPHVLLGVASSIAKAQRLVVITGAGMSAESGIPTFRGDGGLWRNFNAENLASVKGFANNPELVWTWYDERRLQMLTCEPNAAHKALVEIEQQGIPITIVTQNVDNLHQLAGSSNVIPIHGNILGVRCVKTNEKWKHEGIHSELPPKCKCGSIIRPDVLWFGEEYDMGMYSHAQQAILNADVILVIGTSWSIGAVFYMISESFAEVIEFNLEHTDLSPSVHKTVLGPIGVVLPAIVNLIKRMD